MRLHIDQPPCPRDRRVIRRLLVEPDSQKSPQPERIRRSPSDPALRIDSFKIPNQQQPKIDPRHQRGPPVVCGVKLRALPLGERIELSLFQQFIHSLVERMAWPLRQFIVADPQPLLPLSAPSCPHRHRDFSRLRWHSTRTSDLRKLCSATNKQKTDFHHRLLGNRVLRAFVWPPLVPSASGRCFLFLSASSPPDSNCPAVRDAGLAARGTPCLIRQPNCLELGRGRGLGSFARLAENLRRLNSYGERI